MIDEYLNKSVQTSEPTIEIDDSEFVVEDTHQVEEVDEMISNQFESLKPKTHKRFADLMEDSFEDVKTDDDEIPDFNKVMTFMNSNIPEPQPEDIKYQRIEGVPDPLLRSLILMDDKDEAEFTLSQYLATGRIEMYQYMHYMESVAKYYDGPKNDEKEGLSTVGEIIKSKKPVDDEEPQDEDPEVDPYMAYYNGLLYTEEKKVYPTPIEENHQEEISEDDMKMMSQMKRLLYMDDDPEDLFPEDFLEKNGDALGFNEDDSPEDDAKYDKVLANIKKVNHTAMDDLEDEIEEEEPDNIESYQEMMLEVIGPENESSTKQEAEEDDPENVINLSKQSVVDDNGIFKVQRGQNGEVVDSSYGTLKVQKSENVESNSESGTVKVQKSENVETNSELGTLKVQKSENVETNSESGTVKVQKSGESIVTDGDSDVKVNKTDNDISMCVGDPIGEMKVENLSLMEKVFNEMKKDDK